MEKTKPWKLYVILDRKLLGKRDIKEAGLQVINGGADIIQLRDKISSDKKMLSDALSLAKIVKYCKVNPVRDTRRKDKFSNGVKFIINDRLHIASLSGADGLHLGQDDLPISFARKILGKNKIIGVSAHNKEQALWAQKLGADYISIGSIFETKTKSKAKTVGLGLIKKLNRRLKVPLVAIGGINKNNLKRVLDTGVGIVAVARAALRKQNIEKATAEFKNFN